MTKEPRPLAYDRLSQLPAIITMGDLITQLEMDHEAAKSFIKRCLSRNLISHFCVAKGVYYNLVADRDGPARRGKEAFDKLLGRPTLIIGGSAIYIGSWTTQIHRLTTVCTSISRTKRTVPSVKGYQLVPRSLAWFNVLSEAVKREFDDDTARRKSTAEISDDNIFVVPPEYALADMLLFRHNKSYAEFNQPIVPPDELDHDLTQKDLEKVRIAIKELGDTIGVTMAQIDEVLEPYLGCFDNEELNWGRV